METNTNDRVSSELRAVNDIVEALDVTIHEAESPETRTCITHGLEFLEDHLRRLYGIEEKSGLLDIIISVHPELSTEVHRLQVEHNAIRAEAHRLVLELENSNDPSSESLHQIMRGLRHLIADILKHEHHERTVLIDSINVDQGGEG